MRRIGVVLAIAATAAVAFGALHGGAATDSTPAMDFLLP
jgi:hypothetical protein